MKKIPLALVALSFFALSACQTSSLTDAEQAPVQETTVPFDGTMKEIDSTQSRISFLGKSDVINHEGKFNEYSASVTLDPTDPANLEKATIKAEIDIASIEVDAAGLQGHVMKDDFFSVDLYPKATFRSGSIVSTGGNRYDITGDLTVKDVTKTVTFNAEITNEYLTARYEFPRQEFGIGNDSYGQKLLEPTVPVDVKLVFRK